MRKLKKLIGIMLILTMILGLFSVIALADTETSGYCGAEGNGKNLRWLLSEDGTLTISGNGAMKDYDEVYNSPPWQLRLGEKINMIRIGNGVTSIGESAFANLQHVETVVMLDTVETIGVGAFRNCSMSTLLIGNGVKTIGASAFAGCYRLLMVHIPDSVQEIGSQAFYDCSVSEVLVGSSVSSIGALAFFRGASESSCGKPLELYFVADAPVVYEADDTYPSFTKSLTTLYYRRGTEGWTDSEAYDAETETWNGYALKIWETQSDEDDPEEPDSGDGGEAPELPDTPTVPEQPVQPGGNNDPVISGVYSQITEQFPAGGERKIVNTKKKPLVISMTFDHAVDEVSDRGRFRIYAVNDGEMDVVYKLDEDDAAVSGKTVEIDVSSVVFANNTDHMICMDEDVVIFKDDTVTAQIEEGEWTFRTGVTSCEIDVDVDGDGKVRGDGEYRLGDDVELTAVAENGAVFEGWYHEDGYLMSKEEDIEFEAEEDLELTAKFAENRIEVFRFLDVNASDWYYDAVNYVCSKNMMNGTGNNMFSPNANITRGMIVTILYRLEGAPEVSGNAFSDVASGMYYTDAVIWAAENGIVNGYGNGVFAPDEPITREQLAAVLYRYADYIRCGTAGRNDLSRFSDAKTVSAYALTPMQWAVESGLINGVGSGILQPGGTATRAQAAMILMRLCEEVID